MKKDPIHDRDRNNQKKLIRSQIRNVNILQISSFVTPFFSSFSSLINQAFSHHYKSSVFIKHFSLTSKQVMHGTLFRAGEAKGMDT